MREGQFSRTALAACAMRAAHRRLDNPVLFDDPLAAEWLAGQEQGPARLPRWMYALDAHALRVLQSARGHVISRAVFSEAHLRDAVASGVDTYLILGAGLDSFAWRRPDWARELNVVEIDFAATQAEKQRRVAGFGDAGRHRYLAVDFTRQSLADALREGGVDAKQPVFCSWLGVTPYLPWEAVAGSLNDLAASLAPGSRLVFDFAEDFRRQWRQLRPETLGAGAMWLWVRLLGERFYNHRHTTDSLRAALADAHWDTLEMLDEAAVNRRYFTRSQPTLRTISGTGLVLTQLRPPAQS